MKIEDKFLIENYFINSPIKFYIKPKKVRDFIVFIMEFFKIILAKLGLLRWAFNERIVERPFVFQYLPKNKEARILDIGCSDSIMPIEIASLGYETYGNDLKKYPYKHKNFKFLRGDSTKLKFPSNFFDLISCISTLEHIGLSKDYSGSTAERKDKICIEKIYQMLKKKGILILTVPFGQKRILENMHTRIYDLKELEWLLSKFKKKESKYLYLNSKGDWIESPPKFLEKISEKGCQNTVAMFALEKD